MNRYLEVSDNVIDVFLEVMEERFPGLVNLKIKFLFDTKKRIKQGKIVLANVELPSEKVKHFTKDNVAVEGYDAIIIIDEKAWNLSDHNYKRKLMSHELRHLFIDEKGKLKIISHDVEDFVEEQRLNSDDPEWGRKLCTLISDIYEQEKEQKDE